MTNSTLAARDGGRGPAFRRRKRGLLLLPELTMFLMVGCIRYELGFVVNADGSGSMNVLVAISDPFAQLTGMSADDAFDDLDAGMPDADVRAYHEDAYTGAEMTVPFADLEEREMLLNFTDPEGIATDVDLQPDGEGGWRFSATLDPAADPAGAEQPPAALLAGARARVRVQMPGEIGEHDADRIEDGAFVWELDLTSPEPRRLMARTTASPAGGPATPALVIAIAATAAILAAGGIVARRRRTYS